ncbi:hypothetical protein [Aquimarina longa]|uniref:hypothetical protein n=1 Tax=Aquimarina longa TaxID=1080221 RepID=UPI0011DF8E33|nr:hypothetical protein [Aquimarina longa]
MRKTKLSSEKKYKILEFLKKLPHEEYRIAKKKLPLALKVSMRTFERWLYLKKEAKMEVSADKLAIISNFLELDSIDELINYEVKQFNKKELQEIESKDIDLIKELNLIK